MYLAFIAVPSKGVVTNGKLNPSFVEDMATFHRTYPDRTFLIPMLQDYALLPYLPNTEATWEVWGHHCKRLIEACDEVWVVMYPGWDTSVGVAGEIEYAQQRGKRVHYMEPPLSLVVVDGVVQS
jgi:hypothetical protein